MPAIKVAIATAGGSNKPSSDDTLLADALGQLGAVADLTDWRTVRRWDSYDLVVVRSTWDYHDHHGEFLGWIDDVAAQTVLVNPPEVLRPNTVKTYLRTLEACDVPIVPTQWIAGPDVDNLPRGDDLVVKPSVGASGSGLRRIRSNEGLQEHVASLLSLGEVMIQPFMPTVIDSGETSVIFIGGKFTHAVRKVPRQGDFRVQSSFGGRYSLITPDAGTIRIARQAVNALVHGHHALAFARVDIVQDIDGKPLVGEVELVEPELFLAIHPEAAHQLASYLFRTASPKN